MISRSRSLPTVAARSIECTTSANNTVTCLYSADWAACASRAPHSPQNLAVGPDCAPQEPQNSPVAVSPPPPSPLRSTSVSCHRWSTMSVISPGHLRDEVLRPSYVVFIETAVHQCSSYLLTGIRLRGPCDSRTLSLLRRLYWRSDTQSFVSWASPTELSARDGPLATSGGMVYASVFRPGLFDGQTIMVTGGACVTVHSATWITRSPIPETSTADLRAAIRLQIGGELRKT